MSSALRLLIYDGTSRKGETPLRTSWKAGARVYRALGRIDAHFGAASWDEALAWLGSHGGSSPIAEIQFWGHGKWGQLFIGSDVFSIDAFAPSHRLAPRISRLRDRLLPEGRSLLWFRTCETFGARAGHAFARRVSSALGARVAGHTYVIGVLQSGLHGLRPGEEPSWSVDEGLIEGSSDAPTRAKQSGPSEPNTIHFMNGRFDERWFG